MNKPRGNPVVDAIFGAFFVALAFVVLFAGWASNPLGAAAVAGVVGFLGIEALLCAARDRPSLLSRIGPLP